MTFWYYATEWAILFVVVAVPFALGFATVVYW